MIEVLIRMKMPQCCEKCRFFAWKRGVGQHCAVDDRITFHATLDGFDVGYERNGDCPLVPVPPHGRLIDADALIKRIPTNFISIYCVERILEKINTAPTIIPVSKEDEL